MRVRIRRAPTLFVGATMLLAASAAGPSQAAAGCGPRERFKATGRTISARPPLAVGDSVLAGAARRVANRGIEVDAQCGRQLAEGLRILHARRTMNRLPDIVIWALGTNGPERLSDVLRIRRTIGPKRRLVLVTPKAPVPWTAPTAAAYRTAASRSPGVVHLADWAREVRGNGRWLAPDGIHVNATGAFHYASLLHRTANDVAAEVLESERPKSAAKR